MNPFSMQMWSQKKKTDSRCSWLGFGPGFSWVAGWRLTLINSRLFPNYWAFDSIDSGPPASYWALTQLCVLFSTTRRNGDACSQEPDTSWQAYAAMRV